MTKQELEKEYSELENSYNELKDDYKKEQENNNSLFSKNSKLEKENKELVEKISMLEKEIDGFKTKVKTDSIKDTIKPVTNDINTDLPEHKFYKFNVNDIVYYPERFSNAPFLVLTQQGSGVEGPLYKIHDRFNDIILDYVPENKLNS